MRRFGFILLSLVIIVVEVFFVLACIESDILTTIFMGGFGMILVMFLLGYYEFQLFSAMDDRMILDWIIFILSSPAVLFTWLLMAFGKVTIEWADTVRYESPKIEKKKYKLDTDLSGVDVIVDQNGNEQTKVDFVNWDGAVYGRDGKKYEPKDD